MTYYTHLAVFILCYRHPGWCSPDDVFFCPFTLISHFSFLFFLFLLSFSVLLDVVINVDVSKTDQLRKGNEVVISVGSGEKTCPVKILRRYLTEVERYPACSLIRPFCFWSFV